MRAILGKLRFTILIGAIGFIAVIILAASFLKTNDARDTLQQIGAQSEQQIEVDNAVKRYADTGHELSRICLLYQVYKDDALVDAYSKEVYETKTRDASLGILLSLADTNEEANYIKEAAEASESLVAIELYSMRLVASSAQAPITSVPEQLMAIQLSPEDEKLTGAEKIAKANSLVRAQEYERTIQKIDDALTNYLEARASRIANAPDSYYANVLNDVNGIAMLQILAGVLLVVAVWVLYVSVIKPVKGYCADTDNGQAGLNMCTPRGTQELTNFAICYNDLVAKYKTQTEMLQQEITIRRRLEKSSETITVVYDVASEDADEGSEMPAAVVETKTKLTRDQFADLIRSYVCQDDAELIMASEGQRAQEPQDFKMYDKDGEVVWFNSWRESVMEEESPVLVLSTIGSIDERARRTKKFEEMAQIDLMTGILNRKSTSSKINDFLAGEGKDHTHSLLIIDIDNFKSVNDTLGHKAGDEALIKVAQVLTANFRSSDIVGRLGGDEFIVLVKDVPTEKIIQQKMASLVKNLRFEITSGDKTMVITGSMGHANFKGDNQMFDDLYIEADKNLYKAKEQGKNQAV